MMTTWVCTNGFKVGYLVSQPDIQCDVSDDEYMYLDMLSWIGFVAYILCFASFALIMYAKRELFDFLGDKCKGYDHYWKPGGIGMRNGRMTARQCLFTGQWGSACEKRTTQNGMGRHQGEILGHSLAAAI